MTPENPDAPWAKYTVINLHTKTGLTSENANEQQKSLASKLLSDIASGENPNMLLFVIRHRKIYDVLQFPDPEQKNIQFDGIPVSHAMSSWDVQKPQLPKVRNAVNQLLIYDKLPSDLMLGVVVVCNSCPGSPMPGGDPELAIGYLYLEQVKQIEPDILNIINVYI